MVTMPKVIPLKNTLMGEGKPKVCIPLVGGTITQLEEEIENIRQLNYDVLEWRVDFFEEAASIEQVLKALNTVRELLPQAPLIFTFRNAVEGGQTDISQDLYAALNVAAIETGLIDAVDVELVTEEAVRKRIVDAAKAKGVAVIISNHDFEKTPSQEEMVSRLLKASQLGGDIPKLAVMATCASDVLDLMNATRIVKEDHGVGPLITMSMGGKGIITRLAGELFGSDLTFGAAKKASAPGQIAVGELKNIVDLLHRNL